MKVLQINAVYEYSSTGRNVKETHEFLQSSGIESYVAAPSLYGLRDNSYKIGSRAAMKIHGLLSRISGLQGYFSFLPTAGLIKYIKNIKPDIVHLHNVHGNYLNLGMLLKYLAKSDAAVVITLHDTWFYTGKCCHYTEDGCYKWKERCGKCPAKKKYNKSWFFDFSGKMQRDKKSWFGSIKRLAVAGVSNWISSEAKKSTVLRSAAIHETIYNWIDLSVFKPRDTKNLRKRLDIGNKYVILGISQLWSVQKGLDIFIRLSEMLPDDCVIVMLGRADNVPNLNEKIKFAGTVNDTETLADYYSMADVFVNPSKQESFGKTTAEALACGTPAVGFNATATPELIGFDGKCGAVVYEHTPEKYLEAILDIKEKTKAKFSENCRAKAESCFDKEKNLKKYTELYKKLL